ncbi:hypothetical protein ENBRE01_0459 [Enteropsectra breve]|nr:hypothetical protein ENBRE01_0459 [Enteropsectra breve]
MENIMLRSETLALVLDIFKNKIKYNFNTSFGPGAQNRIHLNIEKSDIQKVFKLVSHLTNAETVESGTNYYFPFDLRFLRAEMLVSFVVSVFLLTLVSTDFNCSIASMGAITMTYYFNPLVCFEFINYAGRTQLVFLFGIINYKYAVLFCACLLAKIWFEYLVNCQILASKGNKC